jgi:hypothetical protein
VHAQAAIKHPSKARNVRFTANVLSARVLAEKIFWTKFAEMAVRRRNKIIAIVLLCVVFVAVVLYGLVSIRNQTQAALKAPIHDAKPINPPQTMETEPVSFTLTKAVTIQIPYGSLTLPVGTRLTLVTREDEDVIFRYVDGDYSIPISSTDLR